jgi:hypothetical protein
MKVYTGRLVSLSFVNPPTFLLNHAETPFRRIYNLAINSLVSRRVGGLVRPEDHRAEAGLRHWWLCDVNRSFRRVPFIVAVSSWQYVA